MYKMEKLKSIPKMTQSIDISTCNIFEKLSIRFDYSLVYDHFFPNIFTFFFVKIIFDYLDLATFFFLALRSNLNHFFQDCLLNLVLYLEHIFDCIPTRRDHEKKKMDEREKDLKRNDKRETFF